MQKQTTTRLHLLLAWLVESAVGYDEAGEAGVGGSLAGAAADRCQGGL